MPPTVPRRLRRLIEAGNHRLDFSRPAARVLLVLLASAAAAALAAAAWLIHLDTRSAAPAITDPREAYVARVREKLQMATDVLASEGAQQGRSGSLVLRVEVNADGGLAYARVERSSGVPALDEIALRAVRDSAPFEPFPPDVRKNTAVIEIVSAFRFR